MTTQLIAPHHTSNPATKCGNGTGILIVEDDPDTRSAFETQLKARNFEVLSVGDGYRAIALVQLRRPDLVVLDLGLPGVDGIELLRRLRLVMQHPPAVIVVSAWDESRYEPLAMAQGASLYLEKPVGFPDLLNGIEHVLRER